MSKNKDRYKNLELDGPDEIKIKKGRSKRRLEIFGLPEKKQRKVDELEDVKKPQDFKKREISDSSDRPTEKVKKQYIESRREKANRVKNLRKKRLKDEQIEIEKMLAKQRNAEAKAKAKKNIFMSIGRVIASGILPIGIMMMRMGVARRNPFFILFMAVAFILQLIFGSRESRRNFWRRY